jgi:hypothetical protein
MPCGEPLCIDQPGGDRLVDAGLTLVFVLLYGGNSPAYWTLFGFAIIALFILQCGLTMARGGHWTNARLAVPALLYLSVLAWGLLQTWPAMPSAWAHPFWELVPDADATISATPVSGGHGVLRLATYAMIFWIALQASMNAKRAWRFLAGFGLFSTALAFFGLYAALSGTNPILLDHASSNVSASFINRNSYALYAAMGLVTNLGLYLDLVRSGSVPSGSRGSPSRVSRTLLFGRVDLPVRRRDLPVGPPADREPGRRRLRPCRSDHRLRDAAPGQWRLKTCLAIGRDPLGAFLTVLSENVLTRMLGTDKRCPFHHLPDHSRTPRRPVLARPRLRRVPGHVPTFRPAGGRQRGVGLRPQLLPRKPVGDGRRPRQSPSMQRSLGHRRPLPGRRETQAQPGVFGRRLRLHRRGRFAFARGFQPADAGDDGDVRLHPRRRVGACLAARNIGGKAGPSFLRHREMRRRRSPLNLGKRAQTTRSNKFLETCAAPPPFSKQHQEQGQRPRQPADPARWPSISEMRPERQRKGYVMDTFSSKANKDANRLGAGRCSGLSFVDKEHDPMSKTPHPYRIHEPRTSFLKQTMARAVTPRAKARAEALRELERLIAIKADGGSLGVRGHLLASIARDYPVSRRE